MVEGLKPATAASVLRERDNCVRTCQRRGGGGETAGEFAGTKTPNNHPHGKVGEKAGPQRRDGEGDFTKATHLLCENLAQLHPPLVKRRDVPHEALHGRVHRWICRAKGALRRESGGVVMRREMGVKADPRPDCQTPTARRTCTAVRCSYRASSCPAVYAVRRGNSSDDDGRLPGNTYRTRRWREGEQECVAASQNTTTQCCE